MPRVLGFEGNPQPVDGLSWGVAAVEHEGRVRNTATGLIVSRTEFDRLAREGSVVKLPDPIEAPDTAPCRTLLGLSARADMPLYDATKGFDTFALGKRRYRRAGTYYVFAGRDKLLGAAAGFNEQVADRLLYGGVGEDPHALLRLGLTLDAANPILNAYWAYLNRDKTFVAALARQNVLRGAASVEMFQEILDGLDAINDTRRELVYTGGEATASRMDLGTVQSTFTSLEHLFSWIRCRIEDVFPFLAKAQRPALVAQHAASVHWVFDVSGDATVGERLASRLLWNRFVDLLASPGELEAHVRRACESVLSPAPGLKLRISGVERQLWSTQDDTSERTRWVKRLSRTDAQVPGEGGLVPYLRLTKGSLEIDHHTWFRDEFFSSLEWGTRVWKGATIQTADLSCLTDINGLSIGIQKFEITHDPRRKTANGAPSTWLHWNDTLRQMLGSWFFAFYWVVLERRNGSYSLSIVAGQPNHS